MVPGVRHGAVDGTPLWCAGVRIAAGRMAVGFCFHCLVSGSAHTASSSPPAQPRCAHRHDVGSLFRPPPVHSLLLDALI